MYSYLCRFGLGMIPAMGCIYINKQIYNEATDVPSDDLLVQKILGEHHTCRWTNKSRDFLVQKIVSGNTCPLEKSSDELEDGDASTMSSTLFGYPVLMMSKQDFATSEGIKAHELCHIKNSDSAVHCLIPGMTFATTSMTLKRCTVPSSSIVRRFGQNILREGVAIGTAVGISRIYPLYYDPYMEKRADLEGFSFCSKEGQAKYIQFFRNHQQKNLASLNEATDYAKELQQGLQKWFKEPESKYRQKRIQFFQDAIDTELPKIQKVISSVAENGDDLSDKKHPLLSERIAYLEKAYRDLHGENPPQSFTS